MMLHSLPLIGYTGTTMNDGILPRAILAKTQAQNVSLICILNLYPDLVPFNFLALA